MTENTQTQKPRGLLAKTLKLFGIIVAILLVPVVLGQLQVSEESVRIVGRVAAAVTLVLFLYGIFAKLLRVLGLVIAGLTVLVVLLSEGVIHAPLLVEMLR